MGPESIVTLGPVLRELHATWKFPGTFGPGHEVFMFPWRLEELATLPIIFLPEASNVEIKRNRREHVSTL